MGASSGLKPRPPGPLLAFAAAVARGRHAAARRARAWRTAFRTPEGGRACERAPAAARTQRRPAAELRAYHGRLGASRVSLDHLEQLAAGEAVCTVSGQQPAPLGGPLYSLHKIAASVGMSDAATARIGVPCVPLFWMHGEDSD